MTARPLALCCLALALAAARPASADEGDAREPAAGPVAAAVAPPATPWQTHPLALEAQFALAGPLGGAGVALDAYLSDWVAINAGVGVGRAAGDSAPLDRVQLAVTPRFRIPIQRSPQLASAIGIEAGVSTGAYKEVFGCFLFSDESCVPKAWRRAVWQNTNLVIEARRERVQLRIFGGVGTPLAAEGTRNCERARDDQVHCSSAPAELPWKMLNLGAAIGYAF